MSKYPRTPHFSFSPESPDNSKKKKNDDKTVSFSSLGNFISNETVDTEKMDGENTKFSKKDGVYARSSAQPTSFPTFDYVKNVHYYPKLHLLNEDYLYYGENLYGIHSIEYENLTDYFYLFNILDTKNNEWLSYDEFLEEAKRLGYNTVPLVRRGVIENMVQHSKFLAKELKKKSSFGTEREGFVTRVTKRIPFDDFGKYVGKYVRKGHVQTDEHWRTNWKAAKLNPKID